MLRREGLEGTDVFPFPSVCLVASSHTGAVCGQSWGRWWLQDLCFQKAVTVSSGLVNRSSWFLLPLARSLPELPRPGCCVVDAGKH